MTLKEILAERKKAQAQAESATIEVRKDDENESADLVYAMIPSLRVQTDRFSEIF